MSWLDFSFTLSLLSSYLVHEHPLNSQTFLLFSSKKFRFLLFLSSYNVLIFQTTKATFQHVSILSRNLPSSSTFLLEHIITYYILTNFSIFSHLCLLAVNNFRFDCRRFQQQALSGSLIAVIDDKIPSFQIRKCRSENFSSLIT